MLKVPGRGITDIPVLESDVPRPEEIAILPRSLLSCLLKIVPLLRGVTAKWGVGGDAGEVIMGVNLDADHLEILTTAEGCRQIADVLLSAGSVTSPPTTTTWRLERDANVPEQEKEQKYPLHCRSQRAGFSIDGVTIVVDGDLQFKVGDWEWGDPLDFQPDYSYITGEKVPVVPLRLKSELYLGLGWMDRLDKISTATRRAQHHIR